MSWKREPNDSAGDVWFSFCYESADILYDLEKRKWTYDLDAISHMRLACIGAVGTPRQELSIGARDCFI